MDLTNHYARWFGRVVLLGVAANLVLALPALFEPNAVLGTLGLTPDLEHPLWPSFASLLLLLLSAFYVPGAMDPERYLANALLAIGARFAGFCFFVLRPTEYPLFGYFDLTFAVPEAILLLLWLRTKHRPSLSAAAKELQHVNASA